MKKSKELRRFSIQRFFAYIKTIDHVWLFTWLFIYISFCFLDAFTHLKYGDSNIHQIYNVLGREFDIEVIHGGTFIGTTLLKYTGIVLNVLYAMKKFPKDYLLQIALAFTLLADTILCVNSTAPIGVFVFCFAQYFHSSRFAGAKPRLFAGWTIGLVTLMFFGHLSNLPMIFVLGTIYASLLLTNIMLTYQWYKTKRISSIEERGAADTKTEREIIASTCAFFGFILFASCDLCVAVSFLSNIRVLPDFLYMPANYFSWVFYYISQVLIANSSILTEKRQKKKKIAQTAESMIQ